MNASTTLNSFFVVDPQPPAECSGPCAAVFFRLKPRGVPQFPLVRRNSAYLAIANIARMVTDAVDPASTRKNTAEVAEGSSGFLWVLVQAAIAAAKSDQRLAQNELEDLAASLREGQRGDAEIERLREEVLRPPMIEHMTRAPYSRAQTVEIYTTSWLATNARNELSEHYLKMLAARLGLERAITDRVALAIHGNQK